MTWNRMHGLSARTQVVELFDPETYKLTSAHGNKARARARARAAA